MTERTPPMSETDRERRLAAALRRNLQRRKAQKRGRTDASSPQSDPDGPPDRPQGGCETPPKT